MTDHRRIAERLGREMRGVPRGVRETTPLGGNGTNIWSLNVFLILSLLCFPRVVPARSWWYSVTRGLVDDESQDDQVPIGCRPGPFYRPMYSCKAQTVFERYRFGGKIHFLQLIVQRFAESGCRR